MSQVQGAERKYAYPVKVVLLVVGGTRRGWLGFDVDVVGVMAAKT